jgi:hypothetical protein
MMATVQPTNIRLGCKFLPGTNLISADSVNKSFIASTPGANVIKLFTAVRNDFSK